MQILVEALAEIDNAVIRAKVRRFVLKMSDEFALEEPEDINIPSAIIIARRLAGSAVDKNQVHGLVAIAETTGSVADIIDFVKIRVGRDRAERAWRQDDAGILLIKYLLGLRSDVDGFLAKLNNEFGRDFPILRLPVHLQLCRAFLHHMAAHYDYLKLVGSEEAEEYAWD